MQLFMHGISYGTTEEDLYTALAHLIHRPPVQLVGQPFMNFHIQLFYKTRSHSHRGLGILTLPTDTAGHAFLSVYSRYPLHGRTISFQASNRPPDTARIQNVATTRWREPQALREERESVQQFSSSIRLVDFSFGHICRDGVFSPEATFQGSVSCDISSRRLVISLPQSSRAVESDSDSLLTSLFRRMGLGSDDILTNSDTTSSLWYIASRIVSYRETSLDSRNHRVFLESELAPTFLQTSEDSLIPDAKPINHRMSSPQQNFVLPPVGRNICLTFPSREAMDNFRSRSRHLHFPRAIPTRVEVSARRLYSESNLRGFGDALKTLPFRLAFELDKVMWTGILSPPEILDIMPSIQKIQRDHPQNCDGIFRYFISQLSNSPVAINNPPANPARRRRRRRRNRAQQPRAPEIRETRLGPLLERAATESSMIDQSRQYSPSLGIYQSYHLVLTPTTQVLEGPLPDQSNALLRRFGDFDSFLRISFQDEEGCTLRRQLDLDIGLLLRERYKGALLSGISVAGRSYEWLGYSMSGLKEHTFWFVNSPVSFEGRLLDAVGIRAMLGDFSRIEKKPALLGARWAQAFSTSVPSVTVESGEIRRIPDIVATVGSTNAMFTDGVSPISSALSRAIWKKLKGSDSRNITRPSCYQFRFGGAKGVIVEHNTLHRTSKVLCLRPSQTKFVADGVRTLDITTTSTRPILCFLNRPLIAILEHHGVPSQNFRRLQDTAISEIQETLTSTEKASTLFLQYGLGSSFRLPSLFLNVVRLLEHEISDSILPTRRVFHHELVNKCLVHGANYVLRDIKHRAHIYIPGSYTLIGVADEWDILPEGEIYAHVVDSKRDVDLVIGGQVLITRSPQIHPGDVQFCRAIGRHPRLAHLVNVVVFSCRGARSLASKLGGGDLDGDIYNLILERSLFPPKEDIGQAGAYQGLPHRETASACTISDVADFVTDFIQTDILGYISILFLRIADLQGVDHRDCLSLAEKASHAVDYPKVGRPVNIKELPRPPNSELRPDFLSGEGADLSSDNSRFYPSRKVLGQLFRNVPTLEDKVVHVDVEVGDKILDAIDALHLEDFGLFPDLVCDIERDLDPDLEMEMERVFKGYTQDLWAIAKTHTISKKPEAHLSEAEILSGTIHERYSDAKRRREAVRVMNLQTKELVKRIHDAFLPPTEAQRQEEDEDDDEVDPDDDDFDSYKNSMIYRRAYASFLTANDALEEHPHMFGAQSFGLIALSALLAVAKRVMNPTYQTRYI